jgi:hypothetical protein
MGSPQSPTIGTADDGVDDALPPIGGLTGTVGPDHRFILSWTPDPA